MPAHREHEDLPTYPWAIDELPPPTATHRERLAWAADVMTSPNPPWDREFGEREERAQGCLPCAE
jgi:hypothetical protein